MNTLLSQRIRPDCEAAPWVIQEVLKLEAKNAELVAALERIKAVTGDEADTWEEVAGWMARQAIYALARDESATPDATECASDYASQLAEDKRNESAERMAGIQSLAESATPAKEEPTYHVPHARTIAQPAKLPEPIMGGLLPTPEASWGTPAKHPDTVRLALFTWDGENHASLPANAYYQVTSGLLRFPMPVGNGSISVGMSLVLLDGKVVAIDAAIREGGSK